MTNPSHQPWCNRSGNQPLLPTNPTQSAGVSVGCLATQRPSRPPTSFIWGSSILKSINYRRSTAATKYWMRNYCGWTKSCTTSETLVSDNSPANTNKEWFPMVSKWCEMDFVHPQYVIYVVLSCRGKPCQPQLLGFAPFRHEA